MPASDDEQILKWQRINLVLIEQRFRSPGMQHAEADLASHGWPLRLSPRGTQHLASLLLETREPTEPAEQSRLRDGYRDWLHFCNVVAYARECSLVPSELPRPMAEMIYQLLGVEPILEYARTAPLPLVYNLQLGAGSASGFVERGTDALHAACADVIHLYGEAQRDRDLRDIASRMARGLSSHEGLAGIGACIGGLDLELSEADVAAALTAPFSDGTRPILGLVKFAEFSAELTEACDLGRQHLAERTRGATAELCAAWFAGLDDEKIAAMGTLFQQLSRWKPLAAFSSPRWINSIREWYAGMHAMA